MNFGRDQLARWLGLSPEGDGPVPERISRRETAGLLLMTALVALAICFFPPSLDKAIDYIAFYSPNFHFLWETLREGHGPLWNPYIGLGRPFLADSQNAVFYPPFYFFALGKSAGLFLLVWTHCALAAVGMRLLANVLRLGPAPARFVIFSLLLSGFLTGRWFSGQLLYAGGLCYLPILLWNATRLGESWDGRRLGLQALLLALQFLSGHPQVFWFCTLAQAAFLAGYNPAPPWREGLRRTLRSLLQFLVACLWSLALAAVMLLPFLELIKEGNRAVPSTEFANFVRMEWSFFQSLYGTTVDGFLLPWEVNLYIGGGAVVLGLAGLCRVKERGVRGLLAVVFFGLLASIGDYSPLFTVFFKWLPGYSSLRIHAREAMLLAFALLCGLGICLSRPHPRFRALFEANFRLPFRYLFPALALVQTLLLLHLDWLTKTRYPPRDGATHVPSSPIQKTIAARLKEAGWPAPGQPPPRVSVPGKRSTSNNAMFGHYSTFDAYTSLFLKRPWSYLHAMVNLDPPRLNNTFLSEHVYDRGAFPYADINLVAGVDHRTGDFLFATNPSPRAFTVFCARRVPDYQTAVTNLARGHDLHQCALVESPLPLPLPESTTLPAVPAVIKHFEGNSLSLQVDTAADGLLVVAEAWYPGWRALVDGAPQPVFPVNAWMRGVAVTKGRHEVRLYYHQNYLAAGAAISTGALAALLVAFSVRRKKTSAPLGTSFPPDSP